MNGLMRGNKLGFTFLELVIVVAIIALMAAIVIPNLRVRIPGQQRKEFVDRLNSLLQIAWQDAVATGKLHRIMFDITKRKIIIEISTDKKSAFGDFIFEPIKTKFLNTSYEWPENNFEFVNFYIENRDEMKLTLKEGKGKVWFFISADGLSQPIIINLLDIKNISADKKGIEFSLVLNPFTVQFKEYDTFQRP